MARRLSLPLILVALLAVFAAPASAHYWQGWDDQYWDPYYQDPPSYDPPAAPTSDAPAPDAPSTDAPASDSPSSAAPGGARPEWNGGGDWNPRQGDAQETPHDWTRQPRENGSNDGWNVPPLPVSNTPTVAGETAMVRRNGLAAIPRGAPARIRAIIAAANQIIGKPYKWGGGHGRLFDSGYDCSGSVSYALIRAGILSYPMVSGTFARWGARGAGRYVTIYANRGHVYMEVAGLRLDTSAVGDPSQKSGVRWRPPIGKRVTFAPRHVPGL